MVLIPWPSKRSESRKKVEGHGQSGNTRKVLSEFCRDFQSQISYFRSRHCRCSRSVISPNPVKPFSLAVRMPPNCLVLLMIHVVLVNKPSCKHRFGPFGQRQVWRYSSIGMVKQVLRKSQNGSPSARHPFTPLQGQKCQRASLPMHDMARCPNVIGIPEAASLADG